MQLIDIEAYCETCGEKNWSGERICKFCRLWNAPRIIADKTIFSRWHTLREGKTFKEVECIHCNASFRYQKKNGIYIDQYLFCPACGATMTFPLEETE